MSASRTLPKMALFGAWQAESALSSAAVPARVVRADDRSVRFRDAVRSYSQVLFIVVVVDVRLTTAGARPHALAMILQRTVHLDRRETKPVKLADDAGFYKPIDPWTFLQVNDRAKSAGAPDVEACHAPLGCPMPKHRGICTSRGTGVTARDGLSMRSGCPQERCRT